MAAAFNPAVNMFLPPPRQMKSPFHLPSVSIFIERIYDVRVEEAVLQSLAAALTETLRMAENRPEETINMQGFRAVVMGLWQEAEQPPPFDGHLIDPTHKAPPWSGDNVDFAARVILCSAAKRAKGRGAPLLSTCDLLSTCGCAPPQARF